MDREEAHALLPCCCLIREACSRAGAARACARNEAGRAAAAPSALRRSTRLVLVVVARAAAGIVSQLRSGVRWSGKEEILTGGWLACGAAQRRPPAGYEEGREGERVERCVDPVGHVGGVVLGKGEGDALGCRELAHRALA